MHLFFKIGGKILVDEEIPKDRLLMTKGIRTTGKNVNYGKVESDNIVQEVYDLLRDHKDLATVYDDTKLMTTRLDLTAQKMNINSKKRLKKDERKKFNDLTDEAVGRQEVKMDAAILSNPELYQGIQKIYRKHGVEIPTHHSVDKNEVITAKKKILMEMIGLL